MVKSLSLKLSLPYRRQSKNKRVDVLPDLVGLSPLRISTMEEQEELLGGNGVGIRVSTFDYSVENHFKEMDMNSKLCGEAETDSMG
ncbi:hypothetical protein NC652_022100 [Populus alba x Populus x berolinensis]|nr:hypothetical protein NC652_022100 [Populus alba x Populus x berolinensis]